MSIVPLLFYRACTKPLAPSTLSTNAPVPAPAHANLHRTQNTWLAGTAHGRARGLPGTARGVPCIARDFDKKTLDHARQ
jgi:hypothetical protein